VVKVLKKFSVRYKVLNTLALYGAITESVLYLYSGNYEYTRKVLYGLKKEGYINKGSLKIKPMTGVRYTIFPYFLTNKGKSYLYENFPGEYPEFAILNNKTRNNVDTERITKAADTILLFKIAGALTDSIEKPRLKESGGYLKELGIDELNYNDTLIRKQSEYRTDVSIKDVLDQGIVYSAYEIKEFFKLSKDDINHWSFTSITGLFMTPEDMYCLYHCGNGYLPWQNRGEDNVSSLLYQEIIVKTKLYHKYLSEYKIPNAIILCKSKTALVNIVTNKYNQKRVPAKNVAKVLLIPVNDEGKKMIEDIIHNPNIYQDILKILINLKYSYRYDIYNDIFPLFDENRVPTFVGTDFNLNRIRDLYELTTDENIPFSEINIICFEWQQEYYESIFGDRITYKIIYEEKVRSLLEKIKRNKLG
jgi:hypothetical protein